MSERPLSWGRKSRGLIGWDRCQGTRYVLIIVGELQPVPLTLCVAQRWKSCSVNWSMDNFSLVFMLCCCFRLLTSYDIAAARVFNSILYRFARQFFITELNCACRQYTLLTLGELEFLMSVMFLSPEVNNGFEEFMW